jgi:hypothetical protein
VNSEQGTGNREQGTVNSEQGTGNREQGTVNSEQGTGNREGVRSQKSEVGILYFFLLNTEFCILNTYSN